MPVVSKTLKLWIFFFDLTEFQLLEKWKNGKSDCAIVYLVKTGKDSGNRRSKLFVCVCVMNMQVEQYLLQTQNECRCAEKYCERLKIYKISEGLYRIGDRNVFIRVKKSSKLHIARYKTVIYK